MKKQLKLAIFALTVFIAGVANAQETTNDIAPNNKDVQTGVNKTVRVIDNKGTIKYLQVKNGLTTLTNTTNNKTTTTWQLGGTLDNNTYISSKGQVFSLDGLKTLDPAATNAATTTTTEGIGSNAAAINGSLTANSDTGFTVLVRDEATGEIKKALLQDLLQVQGIRAEYTASADSTSNFDIAVDGILTTTPLYKVWVYRNGAKLRAGTDYSIDTDGNVTVKPQTTSPYDWEIYTDDYFEVHWIK